MSPGGRRRGRRTHLTRAVGEVIKAPVGVAVPLQRHHPGVMLVAGTAELCALGVVVVAGRLDAFVVLVVLAGVVATLAATNQRRVLAVTDRGVVVVRASPTGRPLVLIGPAPPALALPKPAGLGVPIELADRIWWVDRWAFPRLERARALLRSGPAAGEDPGRGGAGY